MADQYRVIVTGCRSWDDPAAVVRELEALRAKHANLVIKVGDCPTGVDVTVRGWCKTTGTVLVVFEADWATHGRAAGPKRNGHMVLSGGDELLAFWDGRVAKSGTLDCLRKAVCQGVPVRIIPKTANPAPGRDGSK